MILYKKQNIPQKVEKIQKLINLIINSKKAENTDLPFLINKFDKHELTEEQLQTIKEYKTNNFLVNNYFRKYLDEKLKVKFEKDIKNTSEILDSIFKYKLKENILLYRNLYFEDDRKFSKFYNSLSGIWKDFGYISTTIEEEVIYALRKYLPEHKKIINILCKIYCKKDQDVIFLDFFDNVAKHEKEFLIKRGSRFKILNKKQVDENEYEVDMELL